MAMMLRPMCLLLAAASARAKCHLTQTLGCYEDVRLGPPGLDWSVGGEGRGAGACSL